MVSSCDDFSAINVSDAEEDDVEDGDADVDTNGDVVVDVDGYVVTELVHVVDGSQVQELESGSIPQEIEKMRDGDFGDECVKK